MPPLRLLQEVERGGLRRFSAEVKRLVQRIAERIGRSLERSGLAGIVCSVNLGRDAEPVDPAQPSRVLPEGDRLL